VFHQAEADATDFDMVPDESGKPSQRKLTSCQRFENRKEPAPFGNFRESSVLSEALSAVEGVVGHLILGCAKGGPVRRFSNIWKK